MLDMRHGTCAVCGHTEIIDAPAREFLDKNETVRIAVTRVPESLDFLDPRDAVERPIGLLRMLVCRACGYLQWFASRPERIPIGEAYETKLVVPRTT